MDLIINNITSYLVNNIFIYGLKCPITEQIRYIGKTNNLKDRYSRHINEKKNYHKCLWIKKLKEKGLKPEMVILDEVNESNWEEAEQKYIRLFKSFGADLTNKTIGGDVTPDARGENNGNWGKFGYLNHRSKPICVFTEDGVFIEEIGSMRQCEKKYNIDFSSIVKCCKYILNKSKGYTFRYRSEYLEIPINIKIKNKEYPSGSDSKVSVPISQYDLNGNFIKSFVSILQATKETNVSINKIRGNLENKKQKNKEYEFRRNEN